MEPPSLDNIVSFLPRDRRSAGSGVSFPDPGQATVSRWRALWSVLAAHVTELEQEGVIDEAGFAAIAGALETVGQHDADNSAPLSSLMTQMADRVESLLPQVFNGVTTLGLAREEWQATAARLLWSQAGARTFAAMQALRDALVTLAENHAMTLMPAVINGRPAQPTMLGHFLGGVIGPLDVAVARYGGALAGVARSPLGAGVMVGEVIVTDRERSARRLGLPTPVPNTFDAVANAEDAVALLEAGAAALAPVVRLLREFAAWIRTSPNALVLTDPWQSRPEPSIPTLETGGPLALLIERVDDAVRTAYGAVARLRTLDYAPLGEFHTVSARLAETLVSDHAILLDEARAFVSDGVLINRAFLGNRAGRGHTTIGDLAAFLMEEEQLPPAAARGIASIVAGQLTDQALEASAVTQEMVDSAALMVIGREVKVEIERLGRYLAPRRFLERRQVTGSANAESLRAWLESERRFSVPDPGVDIPGALDRLSAAITSAATTDS